MTLAKLAELLAMIPFLDPNIKLRGCYLHTTGGGELALDFSSQPCERLDAYLRKKGFIVWDADYIYRPRT